MICLHPAPDAAGIHFHTAFRQEFRNMFVSQRIPKVPSDAKEDHLAREMTAFERIDRGDRHGLLPYRITVTTSQWNRIGSDSNIDVGAQEVRYFLTFGRG